MEWLNLEKSENENGIDTAVRVRPFKPVNHRNTGGAWFALIDGGFATLKASGQASVGPVASCP
jgi:hypothetical protein